MDLDVDIYLPLTYYTYPIFIHGFNGLSPIGMYMVTNVTLLIVDTSSLRGPHGNTTLIVY
jgi:hypothetical protein